MPPRTGFSFSDLRNYFPYLLLLLVFVGGVWLILAAGSRFDTALITTPAVENHASPTGILLENFRTPLSILLTQIIVILIFAGLFRRLFRYIGQPPVMGEMIAGIVLGPSVLGLIFPQAMSFLFPANSLETLRLLSQIGVVLFMFIVGMELNVRHLREKGSTAVMISHASIIVPFLLGTTLSLFLYKDLAPPGTSFNAFALFIGVAMSITAFPVLARILEDRGLTRTSLGSTAIACAAVDDVTAWCILAAVISIAKASGLSGVAVTILLTLLFIGLMLFILKPRIARVPAIVNFERQTQRGGLVAMVLAFVLASAL